jgi:hypothetical protein
MSAAETQAQGSPCQMENPTLFSRLRRPGFIHLPYRLWQNSVRCGWLYAPYRFMVARLRGWAVWCRLAQPPHAVTPKCPGEVLKLEPGEWVQVKSWEEIVKTLDCSGKQHGLSFTPEMKQHCGKRFRVFRKMELMFDESTRQQRRLRHTVLLEGAACQGIGLGCDRACYLYWREAWLQRVPTPVITQPPVLTPEPVHDNAD